MAHISKAQGDFNIKKFQEQVEMIDGQVNKLFQQIDRPLYSNYQYRSKYEKYAQEAREMLSDLDKLEKIVKQISSEYSSDRDFYIRWANLNICQLKIRRHKETLLSHLKFNNDPQVYEDSIVVWTKEEGLNLKELKRQIERLKAIDSGNIYATIIEGIAAFFEGQYDLASSKIESALKVAVNKTNSKMSDDELDQLFGFCSSWKAYLSFINKDFSAFTENLTNCIASKGPTSSISWAIDSKRALDEQKKEGTDLFIRDFMPMTGNINRNYYTQEIRFDVKGKVSYHKVNEITLKDFPAPEQISGQVEGLFKRLSDLEKSLWTDVQNQFNKDAKSSKNLYKNKTEVFYEINPGKKTKISYSTANIQRHMLLIDQYNAILIKLQQCRVVWSSLIKSNPDIPYFRLYRVKTDLLIQKITRESPRYMKAFNYISYAKKAEKPLNTAFTEYKTQLQEDVSGEIRGDLMHLEKLIPGSPELAVAKLEVNLVLDEPNVAISQAQTFMKSFGPEYLIENMKPEAFFQAAKIDAYFNSRQTETSEFKESKNSLSDYNYQLTVDFLNNIRSKSAFLQEEKEVTSKFKKQPLYNRFLPERNLPMIHFPKDVVCNYIFVPPVFMSKNVLLTLSGVKSQYFRIAILPALDMTNRAESYKNSITDMFYTALFDTKRFSLMDRMEVTRVQNELSKKVQEKLVDRIGSSQLSDTSKVKQKEIELFSQMLEKDDESSEQYKGIAENLQNNSDGVMLIYITNDLKGVDGYGGKIGIDYRIISNRYKDVLYAGSRNVGYQYDRKTETLLFERSDVAKVAEEIKIKFPNPDLLSDVKVIARRDKRITINIGKNANVTAGMEGFVIKVESDLSGNKLIRYRSEFVVRDVFAETCTAELVGGDNLRNAINETIDIGEPIKMK
jgi:hypothetical protein